MDDEARRQLIRNRLKQQHGGKKEITARYQPKYPDSAQREYIRLVDQYKEVCHSGRYFKPDEGTV